MWQVATADEFDEWLSELDGDEKIEVARLVELLKALGPALSRPHADTLNGSAYANMKELRGKTDGSVLRIAFAFDPNRAGILLVGGDKSGVNEKRFYTGLIRRADAIYQRHLESLDPNTKGKGKTHG